MYTLQAMIGIALQGLTTKIDGQTRAAANSAGLEHATKDAEERVMEEGKEWELADNEPGHDGGEAIPVRKISEQTEKKNKGAFHKDRAEERKREKALDNIVEGKQVDTDMAKRLDELFLSDDGGAEIVKLAPGTEQRKTHSKSRDLEEITGPNTRMENLWNDNNTSNRPYHVPKITTVSQQSQTKEPLISLTDGSESGGGVLLEQDRLKSSDLNARLVALNGWSVSQTPESVEAIEDVGENAGEDDAQVQDEEPKWSDLKSRSAALYDWSSWD